MLKYPYARPTVTKEDEKEVIRALKGQFLTGGKIIKNFENKITNTFKSKYAIVCNSGTAALHLIYKSLGLSKGDSILTTPVTFLATASAAKMCNANVCFSDVDPDTGLVIPELLENKLKNRKLNIKIVTVVHLGGRICNLEEISDICKKYKCYLVEDACHAPGTHYINKKNIKTNIGSCNYSIASSFSFHAIKHITMAEGGCITTNNKSLNNKIRLLLNHSMERKNYKNQTSGNFSRPWYYKVSDLGWNYRASEINSALGLSQIKRLKKIIIKRKEIANYYYKELKDFSYVNFPKNAFSDNTNAWHLFTVLIDFKKLGLSKSKIVNDLFKKGIGTQVHYIPLFLQPFYKNKDKNIYKGSLEYYSKNLSLPMYDTLEKRDIVYISRKLKEVIFNNIKKQTKKNVK